MKLYIATFEATFLGGNVETLGAFSTEEKAEQAINDTINQILETYKDDIPPTAYSRNISNGFHTKYISVYSNEDFYEEDNIYFSPLWEITGTIIERNLDENNNEDVIINSENILTCL